MNIFLHEIRTYLRTTLVWIAALCAVTVFLFSMYPAFSGNADALTEVLGNYPAVIRLAFGLMAEKIGTVNGFFSFIVSFLALVGAVQAMTLGLNLLGREKTGRTEEFLLTKPVKRARIVGAKLLAGCALIAATWAAFGAVCLAGATAFAGGLADRVGFGMLFLTFPVAQALFLALGFAASAVLPRIRSVLPVSLSSVFALFAVGAVAAMLELRPLYYLSPFKYVDPARVLTTGSVEASSLIAAAAVALGLGAVGLISYLARDVRAA